MEESGMTVPRSQKLSAGTVVRIRVNPEDCLSILDLVEKLPIPFKENMSFAQCVSLGLSSLLETARQQGLLPEVDGFQYLERMSRFGSKYNGVHKKKLEFTKTVGQLGSNFKSPTVQPPAAEVSTYQPPVVQLSEAQITRINELNEKMDSGNWTEADQREYDQLSALF